MDEKNLITEIIEQICQKASHKGFEALNTDEKTIYLIANLDSEIAINGLLGYYWNSAGDYASETIEALSKIGCSISAELLKKANELFPNKQPARNRIERFEQMKLLSNNDETAIQQIGHLLLDFPDNLGLNLDEFIFKHLKLSNS